LARLIISPAAIENLDRLIFTHNLLRDARARARRSLRALERFPRMGSELPSRWSPFRFVLGPWRWLLIVYAYDEDSDLVIVVTMQDARSSSAATSA
jgi:plasmid stabilization system protein ParE